MLDKTVKGIFVTYKGIESRFSRPDKVVYTGTPIRGEYANAVSDTRDVQINSRHLVVSYWGSIGAMGMNKKIVNFIARNSKEQKFDHIHATGIGTSSGIGFTIGKMKEELKNLGVIELRVPTVDIREYIDNMPSVLARADLVITRAGASTIAELTTTGTPAILVPSPNVTENHQEENARQMQNAGGAVMIIENECTGDILFDMVTAILNDKEKLQKMSNIQKSQSKPDSASKIIDTIIGSINEINKEGV
jgi:UDP-N-acetylglucosamine--N-acetylmuramyl-(pentapeptide) pyrophosphoryl-undecaprenol N-acetylglucosamine transferase